MPTDNTDLTDLHGGCTTSLSIPLRLQRYFRGKAYSSFYFTPSHHKSLQIAISHFPPFLCRIFALPNGKDPPPAPPSMEGSSYNRLSGHIGRTLYSPPYREGQGGGSTPLTTPPSSAPRKGGGRLQPSKWPHRQYITLRPPYPTTEKNSVT